MAIMGFLVLTQPDELQRVEKELRARRGITTYGAHQQKYLVAVAEAPARELEALGEEIASIPGVLNLYPTFMTVEDEQFLEFN